MTAFGNFLYALRKEKGMTQQELAEKLNITNKAVSKWETGEAFPETSQLVPLANIFGVSVDELLRGERTAGKSTEEGSAYPAVPVSAPASPAAEGARAKRQLSKKTQLILCAAAAALVVLLCVLIPVVSCANNIFRAGKVDKIALGDDTSRVEQLLGQPDLIEGGWVSNYSFYFDKNYDKLMKELEEWVEGASDPYAALESFKRNSTRTFCYIHVAFSLGKVTQVWLDTSVTAAGAGEKELKDAQLVDWSLMDTEIQYRAYYTDGSYFLGSADADFSHTDEGDGVVVTISWTDKYGNACSVSLDEI